jgi:hypothetical protein
VALIPLIDCYELLGIDPKTLRSSLKRLGLSLSPHPTDARIKCLTTEQIELLAAMHARVLRPQISSTLTQPEEANAPATPLAQAEPISPQAEVSPADHPTFQPDLGLVEKLSILERRVTQLADHLTGLALLQLQERDRTIDRRLCTLETVLAQLTEKPASLPPLPQRGAQGSRNEPVPKPKQVRSLNPAEERARSRMPPLIEYSGEASYVIVSSQEGELHLEPDSREWFDWLASISSFRFVGKQGRFTAYRDTDHKGPTRSWRAYRMIHQQRYQRCLGVTDRLTLAWLEQTALTIQTAAGVL